MVLDQFRYQTPIAVRFSDIDALGHVNNATYMTYVEYGRVCYARDVCGWEGDMFAIGMIVARVEVDYKLPIQFQDTVQVWTRVSRFGTKSLDFEYAVTRRQGDGAEEIAALSRTVMVSYDYQKQATIPVPTSWRERITAYEAVSPNT